MVTLLFAMFQENAVHKLVSLVSQTQDGDLKGKAMTSTLEESSVMLMKLFVIGYGSVKLTGSSVAKWILKNWSMSSPTTKGNWLES